MVFRTATLLVASVVSFASAALALSCLAEPFPKKDGSARSRTCLPVLFRSSKPAVRFVDIARGRASRAERPARATPAFPPLSLAMAVALAAVSSLSRREVEWAPSDEALCARYRVHRCPDSAEAMLARHGVTLRRLARRLVRAEGLPLDLAEDVEAVMRWALVEAMERFDPSRGASFRTYMLLVVEHAGRDFLRREARHGRRSSCALDSLPSDDERGSYLAREAQAVCGSARRGQDPLVCTLFADALSHLLRALSASERRILAVVAGGGGEGDLAHELGCSRDAARVGRSRTLRKARIVWEKVSPPL